MSTKVVIIIRIIVTTITIVKILIIIIIMNFVALFISSIVLYTKFCLKTKNFDTVILIKNPESNIRNMI